MPKISKYKSDPIGEISDQGWRFVQVPSRMILDWTLTHLDVRLYAYILWRARRKDEAFPGLVRICRELHTSESHIRRSFQSLIKHNWIRRVRRLHKSTMTYIFETQSDCIDWDKKKSSNSSSMSDIETDSSSMVVSASTSSIDERIESSSMDGTTRPSMDARNYIKINNIQVDESINRLIFDTRYTPIAAWNTAIGSFQKDTQILEYLSLATVVSFIPETSTFVITSSNDYIRDWLNDRLKSTLIRLLTGITGVSINIEFTS